MTDTYDLATTLVAEGKATLPDGRIVRLHEEQDTDTRLNDFECYGRVEYVASPWDRNGRRVERPAGFDGRAEKIVTPHGDTYWWQPTLELWGIEPRVWHGSAELRRRNRQEVTDILTYGFRLFTVEVFRPCGECGTEKLEAWESVGGVEPLCDDDNVACVIADLLAGFDLT